MARPARGAEVLEMAQEMILRAKTIDELRQAQAVVLPLAHGLSLDETAKAIGRSVTWHCRNFYGSVMAVPGGGGIMFTKR